MANSKSSGEAVDPTSQDNRDSGDESEDECEVLEESPCGRWQKRREEVRPFCLKEFCLVHVFILSRLNNQ